MTLLPLLCHSPRWKSLPVPPSSSQLAALLWKRATGLQQGPGGSQGSKREELGKC